VSTFKLSVARLFFVMTYIDYTIILIKKQDQLLLLPYTAVRLRNISRPYNNKSAKLHMIMQQESKIQLLVMLDKTMANIYYQFMENYVSWLRSHVGHAPIFLNAASGIIINETGEVLLQRRGKCEKKDSWSLPGGVMEIGETPQHTVQREVLEETGLDVDIGKFVGIYTLPELVEYPNGDKCQMITQVFQCHPRGGGIHADGDETLELKYFRLTNRPTLFRAHLERALQDYEAGRFGVSS